MVGWGWDERGDFTLGLYTNVLRLHTMDPQPRPPTPQMPIQRVVLVQCSADDPEAKVEV